MADYTTINSNTSVAPATGPRKRTARGKRPSKVRPTTVRKSPRARRRPAGTLQSFLAGLSRQTAAAGRRIVSISEESVSGARRTLGKAESVSRKTMERLTREWKRMDNRRRVQFVATLLGVLAAASAPLVRSRLKKR